MNGKIINREVTRKDNKLIEVVTKEIPLFSLSKTQADYWWEDGEFEEYLLNHNIIAFSKGYKWLNNTSFKNDSCNAGEVLEDFTKHVKSVNKDYKVFVLQEYRHGGSCFYLTETTERVDLWDSCIVGFIALLPEENPRLLADMITDVYNGTVDVFEVIDNETNEIENSYEYWANADSIEKYHNIEHELKTKYGLDIEEVY